MSATNLTPIINLPLFIGTDKPAWLTDWNGAMNIIDSSIAALQTAESGTATSLASLAQSVEALSGTVSEHTTAIQTVATATTTNTGSINTITSLIGNGEPTTTDKTLIGAINELHTDIEAIAPSGDLEADDVAYDNTSSGLTATDVQAAIDELAAGGSGTLPSGAMVKIEENDTLTSTVATTFTAAVAAIESNINQLIASLANDEAIEITGCSAPNSRAFVAQQAKMFKNTDTFSDMFFISANPSGTSLNIDSICLRTGANTSYYDRLTASGTTVTQTDVSGVTNTGNFVIFYDKYKIVS